MVSIFNELILNPSALVITAGYVGIFAIIFAETGILLGIFLPGDSLLFAAGLLSSQGMFNPLILALVVILAAITGDATGYWIGRYGGAAMLRRYPRLVKPQYIERTEQFYEHWGMRTVVLARFVPIVRTIVPVLAGVGHMEYNSFLRFNIMGGILWGSLMIALGYFLGRAIPNTAHYILFISIGIILLSFLPFFIRIIRSWLAHK